MSWLSEWRLRDDDYYQAVRTVTGGTAGGMASRVYIENSAFLAIVAFAILCMTTALYFSYLSRQEQEDQEQIVDQLDHSARLELRPDDRSPVQYRSKYRERDSSRHSMQR